MDALEAVGDPELRATLAWASAQARPVTADDLAAAHGLHRNVARSRLERLSTAGLLRPTFERRSGRGGPGAGRPAKLYAVSPRHEAIEFPARRYESLVELMIDALPPGAKAERLQEVGMEFGRRLGQFAGLRPAKNVEKGLARLCEALGRLGYQASVAETTQDAAVLATPTCPLRPLVHAHREAAELDRGMWRGLTSAALSGMTPTGVRCETRACLDPNAPCRIFLRF